MREKSRKCFGDRFGGCQAHHHAFLSEEMTSEMRNSQTFKRSALQIDFLIGRYYICRHAIFIPDIPFFLF